mmetsp:Transcript_21993/g.64767  ORF Transcript_21993/g.64767 Transcript_21993/m.64767 type:complete len:203 (+) Transcript_21993:898-1506(+)
MRKYRQPPPAPPPPRQPPRLRRRAGPSPYRTGASWTSSTPPAATRTRSGAGTPARTWTSSTAPRRTRCAPCRTGPSGTATRTTTTPSSSAFPMSTRGTVGTGRTRRASAPAAARRCTWTASPFCSAARRAASSSFSPRGSSPPMQSSRSPSSARSPSASWPSCSLGRGARASPRRSGCAAAPTRTARRWAASSRSRWPSATR